MMLTVVAGLVLLVFLLCCFRTSPTATQRPQGYVLKNQVTHARLLPKQAAHSFVYPTISVLVSLRALERGDLDLGRGWIFGYGGRMGTFTGIRSEPYLNGSEEKRTIRDKLLQALIPRFPNARDCLEDAWMMTMPSLLGFEGINPLTVYFCYKPQGELWLCVLEIHNTFGESHIHVLQVGENEDKLETGSDTDSWRHQWTFRREFHVSPFNDRSGFYRVSIKCLPTPVVRVQLLTPSSATDSPGPLKLVAVLRCTECAPLTTSSLLSALAWAPMALLLSFPRILYHAWILHYAKRLDVFIRPEPYPANPEWKSKDQILAGGVKWQPEGVFETFARRRMESFLRHRVQQIGISVSLISSNPDVPRKDFDPKEMTDKHLQIDYLTPRFFTLLFLAPSASHALLLGHDTERLFFPSSAKLFLEVFDPGEIGKIPPFTMAQRTRFRGLPSSLLRYSKHPMPATHPLDVGNNRVVTWIVITFLQSLEGLERLIFSWARARPVPGREPWRQWERAEKTLQGVAENRGRDPSGSVHRPR